MRDRRQINQVFEGTNPKGEVYTFAYVGTGRNRIIVTLHNGAMLRTDQDRIGTVYFQR